MAGRLLADIESLCREAALGGLRDSLSASAVTAANFDDALAVVQPTLSEAHRQLYG